jgi:REP element-mobilizing transposase RayT
MGRKGKQHIQQTVASAMREERNADVPHSFLKIWIHGVFGTKDRNSLINENFEKELHSHIKDRFENELDCKVRIINGTEDHIHVLFLLSPNFSVGDIFQNVKGESSYWINKSNFMRNKFAWQIGYGAFSVSESKVKDVEQYIKNQKEHHKKLAMLMKLICLLKNMDCKLLMVKTKLTSHLGMGCIGLVSPQLKLWAALGA